jgi:hypothetical protein
MFPANPAQREQSLIPRAPMRLGGSFHYSPDQGDGGGDVPPVTPPKKDEKPPNETEADRVAAAVAKAKADAKSEFDAEKARDKEAADRLKAEEEGRWEELAKDNEAKFKTQKEENRKLRVRDALRDYLGDKHPDRLKSAVDIMPHVTADVDGDAIAAAVKLAADAFIERNPTVSKPKPGGAPPAPSPGSRVATGRTPTQRSYSPGVAGSRF